MINPPSPKKNFKITFTVGWLFGFYGISTFVGYLTPNPFLCKSSVCRLFNAKSIFMQIVSYISNYSVSHEYSLIVKTFPFQAIQLSQTVLFQTIQFSISMHLVLFNP